MTTRKVPITIVTGFLGAGKTTLVRHTIENAEGRRLALIVNEFGDVGVDGTILRSCGIESCPDENIIELTNGCLCCTVAEDFVPTLEALLSLNPPPDHIIVETSGLALPKPLVKAFEWPDIRNRVTVDGVVTVVDGPAVKAGRFADDPAKIAAQRAADPSVDHENPLEEVYSDQLLCADLVVLNKTDLMTEEETALISDEIRRRVPRTIKVVATREGQVPASVLLGLSAAAEDDLAARPSHHDNLSRARSRRLRDVHCRYPGTRFRLPISPRGRRMLQVPTTCCASKVLLPSTASRCGCCCKASANASIQGTNAPGSRVNRGSAASS